VTFAAPGLSFVGSPSKKSSSYSTGVDTATGTGCGPGTSGTASVNNKITTAGTDCNVPPVPPATNPAVCASATTKLHYAYDTSAGLASHGVASIVASLSKGIKLDDNGNKVTGAVTADGTSRVVGGACGSGIGFSIAGATNVTGLSYSLLLCLVGDTGTGTTGTFLTDYLASAGGNTGITIASGVYGGASSLTFTKV